MKKISCILASAFLLLQVVLIGDITIKAEDAYGETETLTVNDFSQVIDSQIDSYEEYRTKYGSAEYPDTIVNAEISETITISEEQSATIPLDVKITGWYQISVTYEAITDMGSDIQISMYLDGKLPFNEAEGFMLSRLWKEEIPEGMNENDDSLRPVQVQVEGTQTVNLSVSSVYSNDNAYFYYTEGSHEIKFESQKGTIILKSLKLCQPKKAPSYEEYINEYKTKGIAIQKIDATPIYIQGEAATVKSHSAVKSVADYSSCITQPYDVKRDILNTFGGETWASNGQWSEWQFNVDKSGFYQIRFRYKQNFKSGIYVVRRLYLDGNIPFDEANRITFPYNLDWSVCCLGDDKPLYIYLEPGQHTIRLEVTYGNLASVFGDVQDCLDTMNTLYRNVMMITGANPDKQRDYEIGNVLPNTKETCADLSKQLYSAVDIIVKETGSKGSETAALEKMAIQLKEFSEDVETIPQRLSAFNSNISSIASWLITAKKQPVLLDYIQIAPKDAEMPQATPKWYKSLWNEILRFCVSFVEDYDSISSSIDNDKEPITIWLGVGRDQALVINQLLRNGFTAETGIPVNLRLITMESLMPAVASNVGPDVAMFQDQTTVINYSLRNAVYDLNEWDDIDEIKSRFYPEALKCYALDDAQYGLPESTSCYVMYYRKDIFQELGLQVPNTWEELYKVMTVLERNNLEFGIPSSFTTATTTTVSPVFLSMLYQNGGSVYDDENKFSVLNNEMGVKSFQQFCELHTKYGVALKIDLLTRFRTGQAPIVLNAFSFSNELSVSAPEISGLWDIALIPGTLRSGKIDRSTQVTNSGAIMFKNARNKQSAWEFLKWWTRADTQVNYAESIESSLGQSGRWSSANIEALSNSAWSAKELAVIEEQLKLAKALPEVAGGYYTGRSINNAIRTVVSDSEEPKETLYEYVTDINKEIEQKREELGLD